MSNPEHEILDHDPIALAVFGHWMETEEPATVDDVARWLNRGLTHTDARKLLDKINAACDRAAHVDGDGYGIECTYAPTRSKWRQRMYAPTPATLRAVIAAQRQECGRLARKCGEDMPLPTEREAAEMNCP